MGSERRRHSNVVLNLTPLIDIVFLLLVFFMLTAHFIEDESIAIDLPEATSSAKADDEGFVEVAMTPDGEILAMAVPSHRNIWSRLSGAPFTPQGKASFVCVANIRPTLASACKLSMPPVVPALNPWTY
ncbi:ExbD/TolR family protein [Candidatus Vondammii sp. HM_W22]|uniref:ExbD/TolR family protein n=1 Tax=Candidatus Vondammii sp. HM_W22 TaxID=2687299 RepID=UPI0024029EDB|nr:biopolymer transporter ExbD [Candidatus Vondammii sp. HM_W22]